MRELDREEGDDEVLGAREELTVSAEQEKRGRTHLSDGRNAHVDPLLPLVGVLHDHVRGLVPVLAELALGLLGGNESLGGVGSGHDGIVGQIDSLSCDFGCAFRSLVGDFSNLVANESA